MAAWVGAGIGALGLLSSAFSKGDSTSITPDPTQSALNQLKLGEIEELTKAVTGDYSPGLLGTFAQPKPDLFSIQGISDTPQGLSNQGLSNRQDISKKSNTLVNITDDFFINQTARDLYYQSHTRPPTQKFIGLNKGTHAYDDEGNVISVDFYESNKARDIKERIKREGEELYQRQSLSNNQLFNNQLSNNITNQSLFNNQTNQNGFELLSTSTVPDGRKLYTWKDSAGNRLTDWKLPEQLLEPRRNVGLGNIDTLNNQGLNGQTLGDNVPSFPQAIEDNLDPQSLAATFIKQASIPGLQTDDWVNQFYDIIDNFKTTSFPEIQNQTGIDIPSFSNLPSLTQPAFSDIPGIDLPTSEASITAAQNYLKDILTPQIQNRASLLGIGQSGAVLENIAKAGTQLALPIASLSQQQQFQAAMREQEQQVLQDMTKQAQQLGINLTIFEVEEIRQRIQQQQQLEVNKLLQGQQENRALTTAKGQANIDATQAIQINDALTKLGLSIPDVSTALTSSDLNRLQSAFSLSDLPRRLALEDFMRQQNLVTSSLGQIPTSTGSTTTTKPDFLSNSLAPTLTGLGTSIVNNPDLINNLFSNKVQPISTTPQTPSSGQNFFT